jgi:hypothetical protein
MESRRGRGTKKLYLTSLYSGVAVETLPSADQEPWTKEGRAQLEMRGGGGHKHCALISRAILHFCWCFFSSFSPLALSSKLHSPSSSYLPPWPPSLPAFCLPPLAHNQTPLPAVDSARQASYVRLLQCMSSPSDPAPFPLSVSYKNSVAVRISSRGVHVMAAVESRSDLPTVR